MRVFPRHTVNLSKETFRILIRSLMRNEVSQGSDVEKFEEKFARYHRVNYARGVFSARAGLYLVLKALHFRKDEEVILPTFNYYEIPVLIKACGLRPVFADVHPQTFNIDTSQIEKRITSKTRGLLITHTFGQPCEMEAVMDIAKKYKLKIIEDCAHACGAEYKGQKVGTFGDAGIFSFAIGKNIPCFNGGMVITGSDVIWQELNTVFKEYTFLSIRNFLKILLAHLVGYLGTHPKIFPYTVYPMLRILDAFNIHLSSYHEKPKIPSEETIMHYQKRMMSLQAAVGLYQLERLDSINIKLRENALLYNALFKENGAIQAPIEIPAAKHIYLYYCFTIKNRELFRKRLLRRGVDIEKNHLSNCSTFEMFGSFTDTYPISKMIAEESVALPNNAHLTQDDIRYIVECVREVMENMKNEIYR